MSAAAAFLFLPFVEAFPLQFQGFTLFRQSQALDFRHLGE